MNTTTQYILSTFKTAKQDQQEPEWTAAQVTKDQLWKLVEQTGAAIAVDTDQFGRVAVDIERFKAHLKTFKTYAYLRIDYSEHTHSVIVRNCTFSDKKYFGTELS